MPPAAEIQTKSKARKTMSTNDFDALMASVEDDWADEAKTVYAAASSVFRDELAERAEIGARLQLSLIHI